MENFGERAPGGDSISICGVANGDYDEAQEDGRRGNGEGDIPSLVILEPDEECEAQGRAYTEACGQLAFGTRTLQNGI